MSHTTLGQVELVDLHPTNHTLVRGDKRTRRREERRRRGGVRDASIAEDSGDLGSADPFATAFDTLVELCCSHGIEASSPCTLNRL